MCSFTREKIEALIDYVIKLPEESEINDNKAHKYPFIACEILSTDINKINDYFSVPDKERELKEKEEEEENTFEELENKNNQQNDININDNKENESNEEQNKQLQDENNESSNIKEDNNDTQNSTTTTKEEEDTVQQTEKTKPETQIDNTKTNIDEHTISLLDKLLEFLNTKNDLNDVLCGYFSKIMTNLINKYPFRILQYLYKHKLPYLSNLIFHSKNPSLTDLCSKCLSLETYLPVSNVSESMKPIQEEYTKALQPRNKILSELIISIQLSQSEDISGITNLIQSLFENKSILESFIKDETYSKMILDKLTLDVTDIQSKEIRYNYSTYIDLIIFIVKTCVTHNLIPLKISEKESITSENANVKHFPFSSQLLQMLPIVFKNFRENKKDQEIKSTTFETFRPLGIVNIKIMELAGHLILFYKNTPNTLDDIYIKSNFISNAVEFLFQYEWNNIYQQNFMTMFKQFINNETSHPLLSHYLFYDLKFVSLILNHFKKDDKNYKFKTTGNTIQNGFYSLLIYLCFKINTIGGGQLVNIRSREGSFYFVAKTASDFTNNNMKLHDTNQAASRANNIYVSSDIKKCLDDEWVYIFKQQVLPCIKLYETKLYDETESMSQDEDYIVSDEYLGDSNGIKSEDKENGTVNPFQSGRENGFFEGVEKGEVTADTENKLIEEVDMKVDEIDINNYNDYLFWDTKGKGNKQLEDEAIKELELEMEN